MKKKPIYLNPKAYTLSATIIGFALIGDYTADQQNAIGNWFMTIGQILEANAAIEQAIEEYIDKKNKKNNPLSSISVDDMEIDEIKEILENLIKKLDEIKKS